MVDYQFYLDNFRRGSPGVIPESEFDFFADRAFNRINRRNVTVTDPPDYLKKCICHIAEILYRDAQAPQAGEIVSESNASYSWKAQDGKPKEDSDAEIRDVIRDYFLGTPLQRYFVPSLLG